MKNYSISILLLLIPLIIAASALPNDLNQARVIGVSDGDSMIEIKRIKIRLHGIEYIELMLWEDH